MVSTMNFVCLVFILTLIGKGMCIQLCRDNQVIINQGATGNIVQGKAQWKLTLSTDCSCPQTDVALTCAGFQPALIPDPSILLKKGDYCSIIPPVLQYKPVSVTYVADTGFDFYLLHSTASC